MFCQVESDAKYELLCVCTHDDDDDDDDDDGGGGGGGDGDGDGYDGGDSKKTILLFHVTHVFR